ncbi:XRE family transcriptional regulator [Apilactobacillus micheneri]|nr:XRE family transcriptional regulator [Apilactobacillus micheneri]
MFGRNLKYLRNKYGMSQLDFAGKLGRKNISTISEWESGKYTPKLIILSKIAHIFNVSIDDLMETDLQNDPLKYPAKDIKTSNIIKNIFKLNESNKKSVESYIEYLLNEQNK